MARIFWHVAVFAKANWRHLSGPLMTLAAVSVLGFLSETALAIPNPPAVLVLVVVIAAFRGGLLSGLFSAAIAWLYIASFFSLPSQPFRYNAENARRVVVWAIAIPIMAVLVGILKQRALRAAERAATKEHDASFRLLFDNNPLPMWVFDCETLYVLEVNAATVAHYGYTREEFLTMQLTDLLPADAVPRFLEATSAMPPDQTVVSQWRHCRKDRTVISVQMSAHRLSFQGRSAALVVAEDISERKRYEEEIRYLTTHARCLLWYGTVVDPHGEGLMHWNTRVFDEAAAQAFVPLDLLPSESYPDAWYRHRLPEDQQLTDTISMAAIRGGQTHYGAAFRCRQRDGVIRWFDEQVYVESIGVHMWRVVGVATDITEQRHLEEQLRRAQRMESIGRLAGGIAHDFNNLITVITGSAELAREALPSNHPGRADLQVISASAERAAALTRQLLAFARKQMLEPRVIILNDLLAEMDQLLRRLVPADIELVTVPVSDLGQVKVDPGQIEQVLVNLVVNACDAMPNGGRLTIETGNIFLDDAYARSHMSVVPGEYIMLAVSDTGMGMSPEVLARVFEPFFTTKEVGKGTGLGLATSYGIVKQHGGHIWVYSEVDHGTTFKLYFPRVDAPLDSRSGIDTTAPLVGTETVLLVEDEPAVRTLAARVLHTLGYTVVEATDGAEALTMAMMSSTSIHLLITDVVMPEMGGKLLADQLAEHIPCLKVLFMSGYTDMAMLHHGKLNEGMDFLQKPFTPAALAQKVRTVLDG